MPVRAGHAAQLAASLSAVAAITLVYARWLPFANPTTVSTTFLLVVLVVAARAPLRIAVATSVAAMVAFNFFFLPPIGTLTIADAQNWIALIAFLAVSLVASNLAAAVRAREHEAVARRDELARLFDLSRDVLVTTDSAGALPALARSIARRFDLDFVAIALPAGDAWHISTAGPRLLALDEDRLRATYAAAQASLEFDAHTRAYAGHGVMMAGDAAVQLVPLRSGARPLGILATSGRPIEAGTLDALGGIGAIAVERSQFLDELKAAELTRQSEQLKAALLASIGHDLRTPLTSIRVAAVNVKSGDLPDDERGEQVDIILGEVERLTRMFENILEMARLEAGAVPLESRRTHVSEIVDAARSQVEQALRAHPLRTSIDTALAVDLDPRLAAAALARVLENAAHYAPPGSPIEIDATIDGDRLVIGVRDRGPGIPAADLPRIFDRFYRGGSSRSAAPGTGMGLWIARGLLAVQGGRIWAETCDDGGARFTIALPASIPAAAAAEPS